MSTIYLLNPLTGAAGSTGANGYPDAMNGSAGGAAYTGTVVGNYVINATSVTGGSGGSGGHSYQYGYGVGGNGGSGGAGINLLSGTLTNDGSIIGGQGGIGGYGGYLGHNGNGGSGGAGIVHHTRQLISDLRGQMMTRLGAGYGVSPAPDLGDPHLDRAQHCVTSWLKALLHEVAASMSTNRANGR